ncbi:MAG TPA: CZB domain-containing protein [Verrucomicrobiae bacterium]|nr:CZB domain-containing protein [Verrucomicrobiae bacterium]
MKPEDVIVVLNAHMDYLQRVSDFIDGKRDDPQATDCHNCKLGKWIYGDGAADARLQNDGVFAKLRSVHEEFHKVTEMAIASRRTGDGPAASAALARAYNLYGEISNTLLTLDKGLNG